MDHIVLCCFGGRKEVAVKDIINARLLCEESPPLGGKPERVRREVALIWLIF